MGAIVKKLKIRTSKKRIKIVEAFFDSGAAKSFLREDLARKLGGTFALLEGRIFRGLGDGSFTSREGAVLWIQIKGIWCDHFVYIVPKEALDDEVLIGHDFMQNFNIHLDLRRQKIVVNKKDLIRAQKVYGGK